MKMNRVMDLQCIASAAAIPRQTVVRRSSHRLTNSSKQWPAIARALSAEQAAATGSRRPAAWPADCVAGLSAPSRRRPNRQSPGERRARLGRRGGGRCGRRGRGRRSRRSAAAIGDGPPWSMIERRRARRIAAARPAGCWSRRTAAARIAVVRVSRLAVERPVIKPDMPPPPMPSAPPSLFCSRTTPISASAISTCTTNSRMIMGRAQSRDFGSALLCRRFRPRLPTRNRP